MIKAENCGLLVVDVQGKLANLVCNSQTMLFNIRALIQCCQVLSIPVVVLEQNPDGLGATHPIILNSLLSYEPFEKSHFNGLNEQHINTHISQLNKPTWLVAGIEAHICVYQTVKGLLAKGLTVEVVADCIASRLPANVNLAIENMRLAGANITGLEMCLFEMMQSSDNVHFKEILKHIK
ncbi:isochorismatase family protein [Alteromonas ponticola]|uniref:Isochorismatase family protein n=1 Tax=Alteromonas aquimaris TaxID=2998417 RepID=A0ABT3P9W8_9ALTE|nr:isochorismatase family protein [Alteromonas aquimaris]MCW8109559.1 isochorismatase family protein [Alteromonas aquimaris]